MDRRRIFARVPCRAVSSVGVQLFGGPNRYCSNFDHASVSGFLPQLSFSRRSSLASLPFSTPVLIGLSSCWMDDYDYLYLIGPPGPNPMPSRLTALAAGERFALYRIIMPPGERNAHANNPNGSRTLLGNTAGACR